MGLDFKVTKDTLIPRPDTEILVENTIAKVNENFGDKQSYDIVDIGTGSGAIILSLLKNLPKAKGFTVDISANAVAVHLPIPLAAPVTKPFFPSSLIFSMIPIFVSSLSF